MSVDFEDNAQLNDLETRYEQFDTVQQQYATALLEYVNNPSPDSTDDARIWEEHDKFRNDTSRHTYLEPQEAHEVVNYVADVIDNQAKEAFGYDTLDAHDAQPVLIETFSKYARLNHSSYNGLMDEDLKRVYFPMRDIFRDGVRSAQVIGDDQAATWWQTNWSEISRRHSDEMREFDPEVEERKELYERYLLDPTDENVWEEVLHRFDHERDRGEAPHNKLRHVNDDEFKSLVALVRQSSQAEQVALLARPAHSEYRWYDVLPSYGDSAAANTIKQLLGVVVDGRRQNGAYEAKVHHSAVVIGVDDVPFVRQLAHDAKEKVKGGHLTHTPVAEHITLVENDAALRETVQGAVTNSAMELIDGAPDDLPLEAGTAELMISRRRSETLGAHQLADYYMELSRVLKTGGMYMEAATRPQPDESAFDGWKNLLAQMVVDTVQNTGPVPDKMDWRIEQEMLQKLGLHKQIIGFQGRDVMVLVKKASIEQIGYHAMAAGGVKKLFAITDETG